MSDQNNPSQQTDEASPGGIGKPPRTGFGARLRYYLFAGILVTAPLAVTLYLALLFINFVDRSVEGLIPAAYNPETYLPFTVPGIGLVIVLVVLTLIGALTAGFFGRVWMRFSEHILHRTPVIRSIYSAVKQILETVLAQQSNAFREAVLVEYPRRGLWAIGFITGRTRGEVQSLTEQEVINVFLPTTPNPTSGFLLFVPRRDLVPLSMSVEEAIKMVISGGMITPADRRPVEEQKKPQVSSTTYEEVDIVRERERAPVLISSNRADKGPQKTPEEKKNPPERR